MPRRTLMRTKAARHHASRKHYAVAVSKDVHATLHIIARFTGETPGTVIQRMLTKQ